MVKYSQTELDEHVEGYKLQLEQLNKENKDLWDKIHEGSDPTIQVEDIPGEEPCSELLKTAQENTLSMAKNFEQVRMELEKGLWDQKKDFESKLKLREEALDVAEETRVSLVKEIAEYLLKIDELKELNESQAECIRRLEKEIIDREGHPKIIDQIKKELARSQEEELIVTRQYEGLRTELKDLLTK